MVFKIFRLKIWNSFRFNIKENIDPEELENVCVNFIIDKINKLTDLFMSNDDNEVVLKDIMAYDGKVCCGSKRNNTNNGEVLPVNAMTAFNVTKDIPFNY